MGLTDFSRTLISNIRKKPITSRIPIICFPIFHILELLYIEELSCRFLLFLELVPSNTIVNLLIFWNKQRIMYHKIASPWPTCQYVNHLTRFFISIRTRIACPLKIKAKKTKMILQARSWQHGVESPSMKHKYWSLDHAQEPITANRRHNITTEHQFQKRKFPTSKEGSQKSDYGHFQNEWFLTNILVWYMNFCRLKYQNRALSIILPDLGRRQQIVEED